MENEMISFCKRKREQDSKKFEKITEEEVLQILRREQELAKKLKG